MVVTTGPLPVQAGNRPDRPLSETGSPSGDVGSLRRSRAIHVVLAALLVVVSGGGVASMVLGWSIRIVESPSMGEAAPVGTLVIDRRTDPAALVDGDVITYRPPGGGTTYTHRIIEVSPEGFRTRGDINGASDAWLVTPSMVVGKAEILLPGIGWILRLAPWLAIGVVLVWFATWPLGSAPLRSGLRLTGTSAVVTGTLLVLRPIAGFTMLTTAPTAHGLLATVVSTGMLPVRVAVAGGRNAVLAPGEVGRLLMPASPSGHVSLTSALSLGAGGWLAAGLLCALPLIGVLALGLPSGESRELG
jgi:signal peptidase I